MRDAGWKLRLMTLLFVLISYGCATAPPPQPSEPVSEPSIPADSPLSKIRKGMGDKEVADILGQPDDSEFSVTGKAFIPFYFGADRSVVIAYYRGLGRLFFTGANAFGGGGRVIKIEYDPSEDGYR